MVWLLPKLIFFYLNLCWKERSIYSMFYVLPGYYPGNHYYKLKVFSELWKGITWRKYLHATFCTRVMNISSFASLISIFRYVKSYLNLNVTIVSLAIHNGDPCAAKSFIQTRMLMWLLWIHCKQLWQLLGSFPAILLWEIPSYKSCPCSALQHQLMLGSHTPGPMVPGPMLWRWQGWAGAGHADLVPSI